MDLLLCCCTSSIKGPVSLTLGYRLSILDIRSVALYCCVLARTKARKAASTAAYLDTHHSTAQSSYLNLHSSGRAQLSLVPSTRQHEQHRFSRSSDRRRPKSHRTRHRGRLREGLPAILCLTRTIHARVKVGEECQVERDDKGQGWGVYGPCGEVEGTFA